MKLRIIAITALLIATSSACTRYDLTALDKSGLATAKQDRATALARVAVKYAEVGQKAKALQILAQALEGAKAIDEQDAMEKENVLTEVAIGYAQAGQYDQALQIAKAMKHEEIGYFFERNQALEKIALKAV